MLARIKGRRIMSEKQMTSQTVFQSAVLLSESLEQFLRCLARETSFKQVYLIAESSNGNQELLFKSTGNAKENLARITTDYVEINIGKQPSLRMQKAIGRVVNSFKAGEFDILCQHIHFQILDLDLHRSMFTKLKIMLEGMFHGKKG